MVTHIIFTAPAVLLLGVSDIVHQENLLHLQWNNQVVEHSTVRIDLCQWLQICNMGNISNMIYHLLLLYCGSIIYYEYILQLLLHKISPKDIAIKYKFMQLKQLPVPQIHILHRTKNIYSQTEIYKQILHDQCMVANQAFDCGEWCASFNIPFHHQCEI